MVHVLTSAKIEYHQVFETQDLSLTEFVSTKEFKEKQVVTEVDDAIITEQVKEKYVEANTFVDTVMLTQPDPGTRASNVHSSSVDSIASIFNLQYCLFLKMKKNPQSQIIDSDDHPDDNPDGEKNSKKKSTLGSSFANVTISSNPTSSSKKKLFTNQGLMLRNHRF
uniref:Uncharacterized protein n=1 Tax=Tanacetum cinerariifolium TaxID=118510 RepID=A0A699JUZ8_TANCI|nr:hypothetical protein [Tanacetum cinerariifolium]